MVGASIGADRMPLRRSSILARFAWTAAATVLVLPSAAGAAGVRDHQEITRLALRDAGWTDDERIERVVRSNVATDMARLRAFYRESLAFFFPKTGHYVDQVLDLADDAPFNDHGTSGFHFNDLYSFAMIETRWAAFGAWADSAAASISAHPGDDERAIVLLGMATHAVQDFYSHSNWVQIVDESTPGSMLPEEFPLWEDLMNSESGWLAIHPEFDRAATLARLRLSDRFTSDDDAEGGLQTGKARGAPPWDGPEPWGHRHLGGAPAAVVDALSRRGSALWIRRIESLLDKSLPPAFSLPPPSIGEEPR